MIVDVVRHAETFYNAEGRLQGSEDLLLSKRGVEQATQLSHFLDDDYDKIFCSSMIRTQQTLSLALGNSIKNSTDPVETFDQSILVSEHLKEMDLGVLEGVIKAEMSTEQSVMMRSLQVDKNFIGHGGESPIMFYNRVKSFFDEIQALSEANDFKKILIVTHSGVLQIIFRFILNITAPILNNADVVRFEITTSSFTYVGINLKREENLRHNFSQSSDPEGQSLILN